SVHKGALPVGMSERCYTTERQQIQSRSLLVAIFFSGTFVDFLATGAALAFALVIRSQGHLAKCKDSHEPSKRGSIKAPKARLASFKRVLRQETDCGKQDSLMRASGRKLSIYGRGRSRQL